MEKTIQRFSHGALARLNTNEERKYYVYRLIDPRTLHTFYVGKGCGDRVFDHANAAKNLVSEEEDAHSLKLKLISEILASGKEVRCIIQRWGLTENEALEVEAALIDCYPGLTNKQSGHDHERGMISVEDFEEICSMKEYQEPSEDYTIIKISQRNVDSSDSLYEATRRAWKNSLENAKKYKYVLSVISGIVKEVYVADRWYQEDDRIAFIGHEAEGNDPMSSLKGKLIPAKYREKGMASPFLYKK